MVKHVLYCVVVNVKRLRRRLRMTSQELATTLGVSISTVSRWETGKNKPSRLAIAQLKRLSDKGGKGND